MSDDGSPPLSRGGARWLRKATAAIQAASLGANRTAAAKAAGINRETLGNWLRREEPLFVIFQEKYSAAEAAWEQSLIDELEKLL